MSFLYVGQVVTKRIVFSGAATGTPTAQVYVDGVATGAAVNGTGSSATWVFAVTVPTADVGDYVAIVASATVSGVSQQVTVAEGAIVEIEPLDEFGIGTGARTVTLTVTVDSVAVQGAKVRVTKGGETYLQRTNVSGQVVFNLDDGTWVVAITSVGASFAGASIVVDGTETATYNMTSIDVSDSDPDRVTAYYLCLDSDGDPVEGVEVGFSCQMPISAAVAPTGLVIDDTERVGTSDGDGLVEFVNTVPGFKYRVRLADGSTFMVAIPATATGDYPLGSVVGGAV